jgi:hypothetical protein
MALALDAFEIDSVDEAALHALSAPARELVREALSVAAEVSRTTHRMAVPGTMSPDQRADLLTKAAAYDELAAALAARRF